MFFQLLNGSIAFHCPMTLTDQLISVTLVEIWKFHVAEHRISSTWGYSFLSRKIRMVVGRVSSKNGIIAVLFSILDLPFEVTSPAFGALAWKELSTKLRLCVSACTIQHWQKIVANVLKTWINPQSLAMGHRSQRCIPVDPLHGGRKRANVCASSG